MFNKVVVSKLVFCCRSPRDLRQIKYLSSQVSPSTPAALYQAYVDCMKIKYNYLLVDLTPQCIEAHRLRSQIYPDQPCVIVYVPKSK